MLSALIAPIQGFIGLLAKIPGLESLLQPAVDKLQEFRNSLKGVSAEEIGADAAVTVKSETSTEFTGIDTGELSASIQGLQKQIGSKPMGGAKALGVNDDGGAALAAEHMAAAARKGVAVSALTSDAADAFMGAGAKEYTVANTLQRTFTPPDFQHIREDMHGGFSEIMPDKSAQAVTPFREEKKEAAQTHQTFKIENVYLQADDCKTLFDFMRQLEFAVTQGVAV